MTRTSGVVKWFNVKRGFGYITRNDTKEDIFVHYKAICRPNPRKVAPSLSDGEPVEFVVIEGPHGVVAEAVSGPKGKSVKGSPYTANTRDSFLRVHYLKMDRHENFSTEEDSASLERLLIHGREYTRRRK
ncbi:cold shock-like protein CspE [Arctopsyche grandis]|uniref:cold shock-like protein CspE n=1 Tax=Arctopsyche grandis TaxID=121162 RepID=UPI00406D97BD